jgi:hypothetical protein
MPDHSHEGHVCNAYFDVEKGLSVEYRACLRAQLPAQLQHRGIDAVGVDTSRLDLPTRLASLPVSNDFGGVERFDVARQDVAEAHETQLYWNLQKVARKCIRTFSVQRT